MQMKTIIILVLAFNGLCGLGIAAVDDESVGYSQTYIIFIDGQRAGKEIVTEMMDANGDRIAQSENDIYITDRLETNRTAYSTRMVLDEKSLKPKSYVYKHVTANSGDSYEVLIRGNNITRTLNRGGETSVATATFEPDMVILDFNVYHQYDYLVHKYDHKKGGRQLFSDFLPLIGTDIPIALTFMGTSHLQHRRGTLTAKNYQIEFVNMRTGTVTTDNDGRLVHLKMPDQNLEVIREDLVPANR